MSTYVALGWEGFLKQSRKPQIYKVKECIY